MESFVDGLKQRGYDAKGCFGFKNSASEIVRIVKEEQADLSSTGRPWPYRF